MTRLNEDSIQLALEKGKLWDFGNNVLYKLCEDHPNHTDCDVILAKVWLIGRAYAAAIERRRNPGNYSGDAFYTEHIAPKIRDAHIDLWFVELAGASDQESSVSVKVHKKFVDLLNKLTEMNKRSFASKYLHFHFPTKFFIYDTISVQSARNLARVLGGPRISFSKRSDEDLDYADFFMRCQQLVSHIKENFGRDLSPRDLDKVLLAGRKDLLE